jgi:hypothetical protein
MKIMRQHIIASGSLVLLAISTAFSAPAGDDLPKRPDFNRYAAMMSKSPFAVATAAAAPAATPNFAKDLYIGNAAHAGEVDLVTVLSSVDRNMKEYLTTAEPNDHGYSISSIEWSTKSGQTKVTISKDGQFATLGFNQALMSTSPPPNAPIVQPNLQGQVPAPTYVPPKAPVMPGVPTPVPHQRGLIQRNPSIPQKPGTDNSADQ